MSRILSVRPCERCGIPSERDIRDKRCTACDRTTRAEVSRRYRATPNGQRRYRDRHLEPKWKCYYAAYAERNRENVREYQRRYRAKHYKSGTVLPCATLACKGTFIRTRYNGSQKFGDACDCRKLSIQYSTQMARNRYERRGRQPPRRAA